MRKHRKKLVKYRIDSKVIDASKKPYTTISDIVEEFNCQPISEEVITDLMNKITDNISPDLYVRYNIYDKYISNFDDIVNKLIRDNKKLQTHVRVYVFTVPMFEKQRIFTINHKPVYTIIIISKEE